MLNDVILPTKINQSFTESGIDSAEHCLDAELFASYPYNVVYNYNSRGFRDREWPDDLSDVVWCLGDSFTVGIGCPIEHTWPWLLEQKLKQRCINISLDGASNNWIARKANGIMNTVNPSLMIIHWSFIERRENILSVGFSNRSWYEIYSAVKDETWPECDHVNDFNKLPVNIQQEILNDFIRDHPIMTDENLRQGAIAVTDAEDVENTLQCIYSVESTAKQTNTRIIHSFIPGFMIDPLTSEFFSKINNITHIGTIKKLDLGRDGYHYDIKTADMLTDKLISIVANK